MGSFNEVCAISGMPITVSTKVKILFLTENPYSNDQIRSCGANHRHFIRTPPIKGEYADYGRYECAYESVYLETLIHKIFETDLVEMPCGSNQYHEHASLKRNGYKGILTANEECRLKVNNCKHEDMIHLDDKLPTWKRVSNKLKKAGLKLMMFGKNNDGYSAIKLKRGIVVVIFNSYKNKIEELNIAKAILDKDYDCKVINKYHNKDNHVYDSCLVVSPKNSSNDINILFNKDSFLNSLTNYPYKLNQNVLKQLSVTAVMVREDVWQIYCQQKLDKVLSVDEINRSLKESTKNMLDGLFFHSNFLDEIPFQNGLQEHLLLGHNQNLKDVELEDLTQMCAEAIRVNWVMNYLNKDWHIPPIGGQREFWKANKEIYEKMAQIANEQFVIENE